MPAPARIRTVALAATLAATVALGACGGSDGSADDAATTTTIAATGAPAQTTPPAPEGTTAPAPDPATPPSSTLTPPPELSIPSEEDLAALRAAYAEGYRTTCESIFGLSPTGRMEDPEDPGVFYTLDDCLLELDDTFGETAESPEAAYQSGVEDAETTAESFTFSGTLCSETGRCWEY